MNQGARTAYDADGRRKYLCGDEGRRFVLYAAELPRAEALFCLTIYYTGCRISEALALRLSDIDIETKVILIRSLKKRGRREIRRVPAPDFLITGLVALALGDSPWPLWRFSRTTAWRRIKKVMKLAKITGIHATTKGLRHGFGVRSAMMRIPSNVIQQWLGHADPATTAIYLAVRDDEERELIEKTW